MAMPAQQNVNMSWHICPVSLQTKSTTDQSSQISIILWWIV